MTNWLKYFPLSLGFRQSNEFAIPQGPYFSQLKSQTWRFSDSAFHFSAPRPNNIIGFERYSRKAVKINYSTRTNLNKVRVSNYTPTFMPSLRWNYCRFFANEWFFVGPWFSGEKASLTMIGDVIEIDSAKDYEGSSFFHPRVFESVVADWLDSFYGHRKSGRSSLFAGPKDWTILDISETIKAISMEIHKIEFSKKNPVIYKNIFFPISNNRFMNITFNFSGLRRKENYTDTTPVFELCDKIVESFRLKVGPESLAQWQRVAKTCPDMSLTPTFGELQWPIRKSRKKNQETEKEIKPKPIHLIENDNEV